MEVIVGKEKNDSRRPLSGDELAHLIKIIRDPDEKNYAKKIQARNKVVESLEGMMKKKIYEMGIHSYEERTECLQECYVAVLQACDKYDPEKGALTSYLTSAMVKAISSYKNFLNNQSVSEYLGVITNRVRRAKLKLENEGYEPTREMLAIETRYSVYQVDSALKVINSRSTSPEFFERDVSGRQRGIVGESVQEQADSAEEVYFKSLEAANFEEALKGTDENILKAMRLYYGIDDGHPKTYKEVGELMGGLSGREVSLIIDRGRLQLMKNTALRRLAEKKA